MSASDLKILQRAGVLKTRRRRRAVVKPKRRHKKPRLSILTVSGGAAGVMTSINDSNSILDSAMHALDGTGTWKSTGEDIVAQTIGYDPKTKKWALPTFTTLLFLGAIASKIANKFVKPATFDAIPFIGRKIKL